MTMNLIFSRCIFSTGRSSQYVFELNQQSKASETTLLVSRERKTITVIIQFLTYKEIKLFIGFINLMNSFKKPGHVFKHLAKFMGA